MNDFSKQEMQSCLQQNSNLLMAKISSRQDVLEVVRSATQNLCTRQDVQNMLDRSKERFSDRLMYPIQDQHVCTKQLLLQMDLLVKKLDRIEAKLEQNQDAVNTLRADTNRVISQNRLSTPLNRAFGSTQTA
jgi:hypothetical protein